MSPPDRLAERLDRIAATAQAEQRMPSLCAAVFREGEVLWRTSLGSADVARGEPATVEHVYRIGSITKTFTAVAILQLRDAMVVDLDDPLRTHVPEVPAGPTIRDALSHLSGFQREPPGDIRVYVGHGGAMPGFLAAVCIHRPERTGAAVLCNTGAGARPEQLALDLAEALCTESARLPEPWRADDGAPADVEPLLGRWWSEGNELVLSWKGNRLRLELVGGPVGRSVSWLTREADDRWRIVEGRELGECFV